MGRDYVKRISHEYEHFVCPKRINKLIVKRVVGLCNPYVVLAHMALSHHATHLKVEHYFGLVVGASDQTSDHFYGSS